MEDLVRMPRKCFHLANGIWYCAICKRKASNPIKSHMQLPLSHTVAYHTMEKCVTAFVGAKTEDIDFALLYLRSLDNTSLAVIDKYAALVNQLRPPQLALGTIGNDVHIDIESSSDDEEVRRARKRFRPAKFKPEDLTIAKMFRHADGSDIPFLGRVANIPPFSATNPETRIHAQHWRIVYDDGDTEDMDHLQIKAVFVLAKTYRDNEKVSYDWNERDLHCNDPRVSDSDEDRVLPDEKSIA